MPKTFRQSIGLMAHELSLGNSVFGAIRVEKFCANSVYKTSIAETGFVPPVPLEQALEQTIRYEFVEDHGEEGVLYSA